MVDPAIFDEVVAEPEKIQVQQEVDQDAHHAPAP